MLAQVGDDAAALRILAIELQDVVGAERYCAEQGSKEGQASHALLLDMLLRPGQGRPPMLAQACHLLAAQGHPLPHCNVKIKSPQCHGVPVRMGGLLVCFHCCICHSSGCFSRAKPERIRPSRT